MKGQTADGGTTPTALAGDLLALTHPQRLALCFGGSVSEELAGRMKASRRLSERLGQLVRDRYALSDGFEAATADPRDLAILAASPQAIEQTVRCAGVVYWSGAIAGAVLATQVAALHAELGEELCNYAVRQRELSGPERDLPSAGMLNARVTEAGWRCLSGWCDSLDPGLGALVRLKLPPNPALDEPAQGFYRDTGPKIIRQIAST